jgi:hypothetical protein
LLRGKLKKALLALVGTQVLIGANRERQQMELLGRKVTITERAIVQRINRRLARQDWPQALKVSRGWCMQQNVGRFYVLDIYHNCVVDTRVDPEAYARDLGVLANWETVEGCAQ